jgi:hypothetical protein
MLEDRDTLVPQLRDAGVAVHSLGLADRFDVRRCLREVESTYDELVPQPTAVTW